MSGNTENLSDSEFIFGYLGDFFADNLSPSNTERFNSLVKDEANSSKVDKLKKSVGNFQLTCQGYYLNEDQIVGLHDIVEDSEVRRTREIHRIEEVGRWESLGDFRRRLVIVLAVVALIFSVIYYFTPERVTPFAPLEALTYEALAMEEDPEGRLDLPTNDLDEIEAFVDAYKGFDFEPSLPQKLVGDWKPDGATIIDYETERVIAIQFDSSRLQEKLFYFNYQGSLADLPRSTPGTIGKVTYYSFTTKDVNIVVWQISESTMGMIIGRQSPETLAAFTQ